jgi:hypothetical protein
MIRSVSRWGARSLAMASALLVFGCTDLTSPVAQSTGPNPDRDGQPGGGAVDDEGAVFLLIDEDSIDNGNPPNDFSEREVNDDLARLGQRRVLRYFEANVGSEIDLFTGQVGDEGWFAMPRIPSSWTSAGPTDNGTRNFVLAGPGLGQDDSEDLLDEIRDVTPLRATGLSMLVGQVVFAVVYDSDISINYSPLKGSLKGDNLGIVAFEVLSVRERRDGSSSDLPRVTVRILDATSYRDGALWLFANAPKPYSSSEPYDIRPSMNPPAPEFVPAP